MPRPARPTRRQVLRLGGAAALASGLRAHALDADLQAPNVVVISDRLVTSGQPTAAALSGLSAQGFGAVIYLAPTSVADAVADEARIVRGQGLRWVNIPIAFGQPTAAHFQTFAKTLGELLDEVKDRKVLVHCQVNMRASSMTFLYRVLVQHESPDTAYEAVARVWSPSGPWKALLVAQLRQAGIGFEPY